MFITVIYSKYRPAIGAIEIQQRIVFQPISRVFDQYFIWALQRWHTYKLERDEDMVLRAFIYNC